MKKYLVLGLESNVSWPTETVKLNYRGHEIWMRPGSEDLAPSIIVPFEPPITTPDATRLARRLLSSLCWVEGYFVRETMVLCGTGPIGVGRERQGEILAPRFRPDYLPEPTD